MASVESGQVKRGISLYHHLRSSLTITIYYHDYHPLSYRIIAHCIRSSVSHITHYLMYLTIPLIISHYHSSHIITHYFIVSFISYITHLTSSLTISYRLHPWVSLFRIHCYNVQSIHLTVPLIRVHHLSKCHKTPNARYMRYNIMARRVGDRLRFKIMPSS